MQKTGYLAWAKQLTIASFSFQLKLVLCCSVHMCGRDGKQGKCMGQKRYLGRGEISARYQCPLWHHNQLPFNNCTFLTFLSFKNIGKVFFFTYCKTVLQTEGKACHLDCMGRYTREKKTLGGRKERTRRFEDSLCWRISEQSITMHST